MGLAEVFM
uniref:Uncharacterized protein n=1 Tax=Bracon brevicornis TaxID=1563983 RepID=A0A6V7K913_9HYME